MGSTEKVRVVVRVRPAVLPSDASSSQSRSSSLDVAVWKRSDTEVALPKSASEKTRDLIRESSQPSPREAMDHESFKVAAYDAVLGPDASQEHVFELAAAPVVLEVVKGINGAVLCYGQTGTGKTHTLWGPHEIDGSPSPEQQGIIQRTAALLFHCAKECEGNETQQVTMQYMQIYKEVLQDLLDPANSPHLHIRESDGGSVYVAGATEVEVRSADEIVSLVKEGNTRRVEAFTSMNAHSSRSHALVVLSVFRTSTEAEVARSRVGRLFLVDLAGSERIKKSNIGTNLRVSEMRAINLSLSALGNCVHALAEPRKSRRHIPFRDSKLTRILQDSLGGSARTALVVCVSPLQRDASESVASLTFAQRAMKVETRAVVHETVDYRRLARDLQQRNDEQEERIRRLEEHMRDRDALLAGSPAPGPETPAADHTAPQDLVQRLEAQRAISARTAERLAELEDDCDDLRVERDRALADARAAREEADAAAQSASEADARATERIAELTEDLADARDEIRKLQEMMLGLHNAKRRLERDVRTLRKNTDSKLYQYQEDIAAVLADNRRLARSYFAWVYQH